MYLQIIYLFSIISLRLRSSPVASSLFFFILFIFLSIAVLQEIHALSLKISQTIQRRNAEKCLKIFDKLLMQLAVIVPKMFHESVEDDVIHIRKHDPSIPVRTEFKDLFVEIATKVWWSTVQQLAIVRRQLILENIVTRGPLCRTFKVQHYRWPALWHHSNNWQILSLASLWTFTWPSLALRRGLHCMLILTLLRLRIDKSIPIFVGLCRQLGQICGTYRWNERIQRTRLVERIILGQWPRRSAEHAPKIPHWCGVRTGVRWEGRRTRSRVHCRWWLQLGLEKRFAVKNVVEQKVTEKSKLLRFIGIDAWVATLLTTILVLLWWITHI